MSKPYFILELKADLSLDDCVDFINSVTENGAKTFSHLSIALPFFRLKEICSKFPDSGITFGQDMMNSADPKSFTGPIAAKMVKDAHGQFVLIGKKEERELFNVSPEELKHKLTEASAHGLNPIYCVGSRKELSNEDLKAELLTLKESGIIEKEETLDLIYELPFESFKSYLPTKDELKHHYDFLKAALDEVFSEDNQKFNLIASLPQDLVGFSSILEESPFAGAFFTKSGIYPHAVHSETISLFHVHSIAT